MIYPFIEKGNIEFKEEQQQQQKYVKGELKFRPNIMHMIHDTQYKANSTQHTHV